MSDLNKRIAYTAIPVAILGLAGLLMRKMAKKNGRISEDIKDISREATNGIDNTVTKLKGNFEEKSASHIQHSIDKAVEMAKKQLDDIAAQVKSKLQEREEKAREAEASAQR